MFKKITVIIIFLISFSIYSQNRYALVIGNSYYSALSSLANPVNDSLDIAATLESLNFEVQLLQNSNIIEMEEAIISFRNILSTNSENIGIVYYAGHGVQASGENYLIPSDARIASESYLRTRAISVQTIFDELRIAGNFLNIIILDACRDNPFGWSRSGSRGLSAIGYQPPGSIVVYSTSAGKVAMDGDGRNGLFTTELLKQLNKPNIDIAEVFRLTGSEVQKVSNGEQVPAIYNQFFGNMNLVVSDIAVSNITNFSANKFGASEVESLLELIEVEGGSFQMGGYFGDYDELPQHLVQINSFFMSKYEITQAQYIEVMGINPSERTSGLGQNLPVYNVSWYDAIEFCNRLSEAEGRQKAYDIDGDIVYLIFDSNGYRLPTEAEWEFGASGGLNSNNYIYSGSNNIDEVAWYSRNSNGMCKEVGLLKPNELGLYDMSGNVYEWCWDWISDYSSGNNANPSGPENGNYRVGRGGSWYSTDYYCRVEDRSSSEPENYNDNLGFRVVLSK